MGSNSTREKLESGQTVLGIAALSSSPEEVELMGSLGFDYVTFDCEHEAFSELSLIHLIRAAESFGLTPMVRLPNDPNFILRCLDSGAQGIHVPRINTKADAQEVIDACYFYPRGKRTFYAQGRSANYGVNIDEESHSKQANRNMLVTCQVEEVEGVNNLSEILSLPGVDVIQFGPQDLWQSMGMPAREQVKQTIDKCIEQTVAAGKWISFQIRLAPGFEQLIVDYATKGVRMFTATPRDFLRQGGKDYLKQVTEVLGSNR